MVQHFFLTKQMNRGHDVLGKQTIEGRSDAAAQAGEVITLIANPQITMRFWNGREASQLQYRTHALG
ncbi:hypothetical protein ACBQ16_00290 [Halopseudomonas bauzanensis]|uniref:hypothetical protein n=1 Tax=Halopseudomonas bauzanensis TaxID=653930 RepID=UPI0025553118|nr:hypothetical protein [Halopseudomonas bauzanensis]